MTFEEHSHESESESRSMFKFKSESLAVTSQCHSDPGGAGNRRRNRSPCRAVRVTNHLNSEPIIIVMTASVPVPVSESRCLPVTRSGPGYYVTT